MSCKLDLRDPRRYRLRTGTVELGNLPNGSTHACRCQQIC